MVTTTVETVRRRDGIAGQFAYDAVVRYQFDDAPDEVQNVTFTSSVYGAPVVMSTRAASSCFVDDWTRYGAALNEDWVRAFFA